ncbi:MAG TPA: hypothetical protein ENI15_02570 [Spirochaetes bacterium]|nr:hypothetical protein [Spirochaetota bacterium]
MIKCGIDKQNEKRGKLSIRAEKCINKFLLEEIKITNPEIIFCTGNFVYNCISNEKEAGKIDGVVRIIKLIHYSHRSSLPLSIRDKRELIWKIQANLISEEYLKRISILELSALKRYLNMENKQISAEVYLLNPQRQ